MVSKFASISYNFGEEESKQKLLPSQKEESYYTDLHSGSCTTTDEGEGEGEGGRGKRCCSCDPFLDFIKFLQETAIKIWKFGYSDPRKVIFGVKMGLTLVLISLLVFLKEPFEYFGDYVAWAIFTAVLIFEYSIGATLSKGLLRAIGTISAGGLALLMARISIMTGMWEEVFIVISIFVIAFCASFAKQLTKVKKYEYGFRVFVLTYGVIMVSGLTMTEFYHTAATRFLLIVIGAGVSLGVNICIYPIWAGEELHSLIVKHFMEVATALEGCVNGYLQCVNYERISSRMSTTYQVADDPLYRGYMSVIKSTSLETTMEGFASWEPPHGPYRTFNYPWKNYVKVSGALRYCTFTVMALHGCIISEIQAPPEWRQVFCTELENVGNQGAKVLRKLGNKVKKMEKLDSEDILFKVHKAAEELQERIDKKLYHLVNSDRWDIPKCPKDMDDHENDPITDCDTNEVMGIESLMGTLNFRSAPVLASWDDCNRNNTTTINSYSKYPQTISPQPMLKDQMLWHSQFSVSSDVLLNEGESKSYGSACALSLARFASLSVEFVARLENLVYTFEELSAVANFAEPTVDTPSETEVGGFWSRCFCGFRNKT